MQSSELRMELTAASESPRPEKIRGVAVFLHGWTGDEHSMDVLDPGLAEGWWRVAPRAPFPAAPGGFSWTPEPSLVGAAPSAFRPAIEALRAYIDRLDRDRTTPLALVGFSQGAAMAFAAVSDRQVSPTGLAVLSGFLPAELSPSAFSGLPVFWSHGIRDERVTVDRARSDVHWLEEMGARVTYCEANVAHKVGLPCVRGLRAWMRELERVGRQ